MLKQQFTVYGRVQGVGFRFYTAQFATQLGLLGTVKNLSDGSVLVIAEGSEAQIDALRQWLQQGSPAARVERVVEQAYTGPRRFTHFGITRSYDC